MGTAFAYIYISLHRVTPIGDATTSWFTCLFNSFTNLDSDPSGGAGVCGIRPADRLSMDDIQTTFVLSPSMMVAMIFATSNNETKKMWWSLVPKVVQNSILCAWCSNRIKVSFPLNANGHLSLSSSDSLTLLLFNYLTLYLFNSLTDRLSLYS